MGILLRGGEVQYSPMQAYTQQSIRLWSIVGLYIVLTVAAELFVLFLAPTIGLSLHVIVLVALIAVAGLSPAEATRRLALALALFPLTRIIVGTLPLTNTSLGIRWSLALLPTIVAGLTIARRVGIDWRVLRIEGHGLLLQVLIAGTGPGLSALYFLAFDFRQSRPQDILVLTPIVVLAVVQSLTSELYLRAVLQPAAAVIGRTLALILVAASIATMTIVYEMPWGVVVVLCASLCFGVATQTTGSAVGSILAQGIAWPLALVVWPMIPTLLSLTSPLGIGISLCAIPAVFSITRLVFTISRAQASQQISNQPMVDIRKRRRQLNMTYSDLAQASGVSARRILAIEYNLEEITPEISVRLARAFEIASQLVPNPMLGAERARVLPAHLGKSLRRRIPDRRLLWRTRRMQRKRAESLE